MPSMSLDPDGLLAAAGKYAAAAAEAQGAQCALTGPGFDAGALGSTGSAAALGAALLGFASTQAAIVTGCTAALDGFAGRLQAVGALGVSVIEQTSAAAQ